MSKRVQSSLHLDIYKVESDSELQPKFIGEVKAGFPSPAGDFMNESIDLNNYVTLHPAVEEI